MGFLCEFGQNPPTGSGDRVQTWLIFTVFIVWWLWKLGQGHQNLIKPLNHPTLQYMKFGQNLSFGSKIGCRQTFQSKFENFKVLVSPWKWSQDHQNLIISFPCPNVVSVQVSSKSTHWFRRQSADKKLRGRQRLQDPHKNNMPQIPLGLGDIISKP